MVGLVTVAGRAVAGVPPPDLSGLEALSSPAPLAAIFHSPGWSKVFDRSSWVFTIWFPIAEGQPEQRPLWPNSPPLPAPDYARPGSP